MLYVVMSWKKTWLNKQNQWVNYKMPWFYSNHCPWVKISGFFFFSSVTVGFIVTESFKSWVIISWNKRSNDLKQITNEQSDNYIVPTEGYKKKTKFSFSTSFTEFGYVPFHGTVECLWCPFGTPLQWPTCTDVDIHLHRSTAIFPQTRAASPWSVRWKLLLNSSQTGNSSDTSDKCRTYLHRNHKQCLNFPETTIISMATSKL